MKRILLSLLALFFLILLLLSPGTALKVPERDSFSGLTQFCLLLLPFMIGTGVIAAMGAVGLVVKVPFLLYYHFYSTFLSLQASFFSPDWYAAIPWGLKWTGTY